MTKSNRRNRKLAGGQTKRMSLKKKKKTLTNDSLRSWTGHSRSTVTHLNENGGLMILEDRKSTAAVTALGLFDTYNHTRTLSAGV